VPLKRVGLIPVCAAVFMLAAARVWLAVAPGRAVRWSTSVRGRQLPVISRSPATATIDRMGRAIAGVGARWPFSSTCLEQGIALVMLLALAGMPARLVIGVARRDADRPDRSILHAHAWVESDGRILLGGAQSPGLVPLT
jgi:Transglutaminase-like superfamily